MVFILHVTCLITCTRNRAYTHDMGPVWLLQEVLKVGCGWTLIFVIYLLKLTSHYQMPYSFSG